MYKYLSLLNDLEAQIQTNEYIEGEKLPSIRSLAESYQINKSTVIRAFHELETKNLVYSVPQSGYFVVKKAFELTENEKTEIDFETSAPDWNKFPYIDFQHCTNKAIDTYQKDLFVYGRPQGLMSLIKVVQKHLESYQVFTKTENIFITSGVQQALSILREIPFPNNKTKILVEQPSYHLFIEHLETYQESVIGIKRTAEGIDLIELERIFREEDIKFFYTMPRFHNPLGTSFSKKQKEEIARLAEKYDVYIVEDDYLVDFEQDTKADPIFTYDLNDYVIYLKSYSKIIFPGLRIGVAVIPNQLKEKFLHYKKINDIESSMISQAALEIYIKSGMFERHRQKIRDSYVSRAKQLYQSVIKYTEDSPELVRIIQPTSVCMHNHIVLHNSVNLQQLIRNLNKKGVLVEPINRNYLNSFQQKKILKLNVSHVEEHKIEEGVRKVIEEIRKIANI